MVQTEVQQLFSGNWNPFRVSIFIVLGLKFQEKLSISPCSCLQIISRTNQSEVRRHLKIYRMGELLVEKFHLQFTCWLPEA